MKASLPLQIFLTILVLFMLYHLMSEEANTIDRLKMYVFNIHPSTTPKKAKKCGSKDSTDESEPSKLPDDPDRGHIWSRQTSTDRLTIRARNELVASDFATRKIVVLVMRGCGHCSNPHFRKTLEAVSKVTPVVVVLDIGVLDASALGTEHEFLAMNMRRVYRFPTMLLYDPKERRFNFEAVDEQTGTIIYNEPTSRLDAKSVLEWASAEHKEISFGWDSIKQWVHHKQAQKKEEWPPEEHNDASTRGQETQLPTIVRMAHKVRQDKMGVDFRIPQDVEVEVEASVS